MPWKTPDWDQSGFLYRLIYPITPPLHNRLVTVYVKGAENVPTSGPVILAANHLTWWDPVAICVVIERPIGWLGKREVFASPTLEWFFRNANVIPVDRQAASKEDTMKSAIAHLEKGCILGIFPEGTRSTLGNPREPKTGAARLALLTGAPVLPVGVLADRFWPRDAKVANLREPIYVSFGEPLAFPRDPERVNEKESLRKTTEEIFGRCMDELSRCVSAREKGEKWDRPIPRAHTFLRKPRQDPKG